jgi:hypothetical protein
LLDAHKKSVQSDLRPAAFVENPKPLLESTYRIPALTDYLGIRRLDAETDFGKKPPKRPDKR